MTVVTSTFLVHIASDFVKECHGLITQKFQDKIIMEEFKLERF